MNIPGEKFTLNLDDLGDDVTSHDSPQSLSLVGDIIEKPATFTPTTPVLPSSTNTTGFPAHKKRIPKGPSRFKQRSQAVSPVAPRRMEKEHISYENEQRLASMTAEEIEQERREIMEKMSPGMIEALLKRVALDKPAAKSASTPIEKSPTNELQAPEPIPTPASLYKPDPIPKPPTILKPSTTAIDNDIDNVAPPIYDPTLFPPASSYHFPIPPQPDDVLLDPSSPEFLESLHKKYYPNLPAEPSKLAWMAPISKAEDLSSYHPSNDDVRPSALRFDFRGNLLPPRKSRELPIHLGLHHHADAPMAAGYTISELAVLARSSFPSQRCMAMQTLGRILYKLGTGVYKVPDIENGLWRCVEESRVIEWLEGAAGAKSGHMSSKAYATEALWLWQKGGGKRMQAI